MYYESLCPDSQAFITKQLYPTMQLLKDFVDLKLIPFGKSTYKTQGSETLFDCHHGEAECYGNKVHACAISHIQVRVLLVIFSSKFLKFINDFRNRLIRSKMNTQGNLLLWIISHA